MLTVVAYDIPDDKRRNQLAKCLEDYGRRVQYSVFEVDVPDEDFAEMRKRILGIIDCYEDQVRYYFLCGACDDRREIEGMEDTGDWPGVIII